MLNQSGMMFHLKASSLSYNNRSDFITFELNYILCPFVLSITRNSLYKTCLDNPIYESNSPGYKLTSVILDIGRLRLFKPVEIHMTEQEKRSFLPLFFANKGLDAINLGNILHHKSVTSKVPPYFKDKSVPIISYTYTSPIASKIFNHKRVLQELSINDCKA